MKRILLLAVLGFFSCKKDSELKQIRKDIIGKWEIEKYSGFEPPTPRIYSRGNGQTITIKSDGGFERWNHDTLMFKGSFSVQRKKDCSPRDNEIIFKTDDTYTGDYRYVEVKDRELILSTPNCWADGGVAYYRKID